MIENININTKDDDMMGDSWFVPNPFERKGLERTPTKTLPKEGISAQAEESETPKIVFSPTQKFIQKMRTEEEEAIIGCKKVLRKMKMAIAKQRNVSMDVKEGIQEFDELICIIETSRDSWIKAEKEKYEKPKSKLLNDETAEASIETPTTSKRAANSPAAAPNSNKKIKEDVPNKWQKVVRKKGGKRKTDIQIKIKESKKMNEKNEEENKLQPTNSQKTPTASNRKSTMKARNGKCEALLIKPTEGHSYADVLKNLRNNAKSDEDLKVKGIRKTKTGALLIELGRGEKVNPELCELLKAAVKDSAKVSTIKPTVTIVIRNLDAMTTAEEVAGQIRKTIPDEELKVHVTAPDSREQVRAYVTLAEDKAQVLLKAEFIKIGFIRTRMTETESVKRCYRCFGIGHFQYECKGPDRKKDGLCIGCGKAGHKLKDCKSPPKCWACTDSGQISVNHPTGARKCPALKKLSTKHR